MTNVKSANKAGRPKKADGPAFLSEELDHLLVHGEHVELEAGKVSVVYPSYRELAVRYGCSQSVIADYAKAHNCAARRKEANARLHLRADEKIVEERAEAIAMTVAAQIRILDDYITQFDKALSEGRVRCDNLADLNTALRLRQFLLGEADSRSELHVTVSLEALQARHLEARRRVDVLDATETGEVGAVAALPADAPRGDALMSIVHDSSRGSELVAALAPAGGEPAG